MSYLNAHRTKLWLKQSDSPVAKALFHGIKSILQFEMPAPRFIFVPLYSAYRTLQALLTTLTRIILWTPLFKGRLQHVGRNLNLYGGLPYISGPVEIKLGDNCRISGKTTISGRGNSKLPPCLVVGSNIDIGWMTSIAVGSRVEIGDNVRVAGRCFLAGYPGHPLNAEDRAAGLAETDDQVGDIILEDDVWLATGVSVMAGVRIGRGTVVGAGSVVTRDLPAGVLAAGMPARVIRPLEAESKPTGSQ
jgi:acetyltransferase-like isoleucine patch superfamily enzyme